jgi:hypothetical protein
MASLVMMMPNQRACPIRNTALLNITQKARSIRRCRDVADDNSCSCCYRGISTIRTTISVTEMGFCLWIYSVRMG